MYNVYAVSTKIEYDLKQLEVINTVNLSERDFSCMQKISILWIQHKSHNFRLVITLSIIPNVKRPYKLFPLCPPPENLQPVDQVHLDLWSGKLIFSQFARVNYLYVQRFMDESKFIYSLQKMEKKKKQKHIVTCHCKPLPILTKALGIAILNYEIAFTHALVVNVVTHI